MSTQGIRPKPPREPLISRLRATRHARLALPASVVLLMLACRDSAARAQQTKPQKSREDASARVRVLTTAAQVHGLPADQAALSLPVHLVATVTFVHADRFSLFVSDATGSVFAFIRAQGVAIHRGDLVDVQGITAPGFRTYIDKPQIRVLGQGTMPIARPTVFRELIAGDRDSEYVSIRGRVRSASRDSDASGTVAQLNIIIPGGVVQTWMEDDTGVDLKSLIDSEIEISAVASGRFNARNQLMSSVLDVTDKREMKVLRPPRVRPDDLPWTPIDRVIPTRFVVDESERVKVRGVVTFFEPENSVVVQRGGESILAGTDDIAPLPLGAVVDVVGFADNRGYGPMLGDAEIYPTGQFEQVKPRSLSYADAMGGRYSDNLISLRGSVLSVLHRDFADSMVVVVDGHPVSVRLVGRHLADLAVGTEVTVTGICRLTPSAGARGTSQLFRLDVRLPDDVNVVEPPSWWTVSHLLYLLVGLLLVSVTITAWAVELRRRVSAQAKRIQRAMDVERERSRLLQEINSATPLQLLLEDICRSINALVANVRCTFQLLDYEEDCGTLDEYRVLAVSDARQTTLFEAMLNDSAGAPLGVFRVFGAPERRLMQEEHEALTMGASLFTVALNQRRLYERLNFHSSHDALTGLPNRRYSNKRLDEALAEAAECGERVGVVYLDVDGFKLVNDRFGHKVGDLYLQEISARLSAATRTRDLLARIGGDEFLLTVPGLNDLDDAASYKQRLGRCFEDAFHLDGVTIRGSASIGLAVYPDHGTTAEDLQHHADAEMYSEKREDRQTILVEADGETPLMHCTAS